MSGGGGDAVAITNWQGVQDPLGAGVLYGVNQVWQNQQANANVWAAQAKANDDEWRAQQDRATKEWAKQQEDWRYVWAAAQAAYAAAQVLLANNALKAAQDQADKQYDIANRQQTIADQEYDRYSQHFAPCENATVDTECARPEYTEPIEDEANRAAVEIRVQFGNARAQLDRRRSRYCIGAYFAADRTLAIEQARAVGDNKEKVRRFLEDREWNRRLKNFDRKMAILNLGRGIKADAVSALGNAAQTFERGGDIELAARNQFYGAVLSGLGGLIGAGVSAFATPSFGSPQGMRSSASVGGPNSYATSSPYGGAGLMGPGGLGYGFGANMGGGTMWDANSTGGSSMFA